MADTPSPLRAFIRLVLIACACLFASSAASAQTEITAGVGGDVSAEGSGLPVNPLTGPDDNGDGYRSDRPVGLARNSFRTPAQATFDLSLARRFTLREGLRLELRGEVFNLLNHTNYVRVNNVYGNTATPDAKFLAPLAGVQNSDPARQFQFGARLVF
jgi:hypothetical protein